MALIRPLGLTPASLAARRANALKSTGPRIPRGRASVGFSALRLGLRAARSAPPRQRLIPAGYDRQEALYEQIRSRIAQIFGTLTPEGRRWCHGLAIQVWCLTIRPQAGQVPSRIKLKSCRKEGSWSSRMLSDQRIGETDSPPISAHSDNPEASLDAAETGTTLGPTGDPVRVKLGGMAGKRGFDAQLAALEALRGEAPEASVKALRKALGHGNNYIVAKAADLVRELRLAELTPELLAAFDRFFIDAIKSDPQCWAKNAISRALAALNCQDADVYLHGMRHVQPEPVWGGTSDTAATLRATCALALVQCRTLTDRDLLAYLIELFADKDKSVRAEVARAVTQVGSLQGALLLRLRALLAGDEPEVLGACFSGILSIEGSAAIPWLARFLSSGDDTAAEAALAIAQDRSAEAFRTLRERFAAGEDDDPWFQSVLLSAVALTRQEAASEFLLDLVRTRSEQAEAAIEAILRSAPAPEIVQQLEQIVSQTPRLARAFATHRPKT